MNSLTGLRKLPAMTNLAVLPRKKVVSEHLTQVPPTGAYARRNSGSKEYNDFPLTVTNDLILGGKFAWDTVFAEGEFKLSSHANGIRREIQNDKSAILLSKALYFATKIFPQEQVTGMVEYEFVTSCIQLFWNRMYEAFGSFTIPDTVSHKFATCVASCFGWWMKKSVPSNMFRTIFPHSLAGKGSMRLWDLLCNGGRGITEFPMIGKVYTPTFYTLQTFISPLDLLLSAYPVTQTFMLMAKFQEVAQQNDPTWAPQFEGGAELANDLELMEVASYERLVSNEKRKKDIESYNEWKLRNPRN